MDFFPGLDAIARFDHIGESYFFANFSDQLSHGHHVIYYEYSGAEIEHRVSFSCSFILRQIRFFVSEFKDALKINLRQKFAIEFSRALWHTILMKSTSDDRRKRIRVPVESRIKHSLYQAAGTPVLEENSAVDLSSTGVSFETRREYQKGALVLLEVRFAEEPLKLLVCVAWVKASKLGMFQVGAELIAIDPLHKQKMLEHLDSILRSLKKKKSAKKAKVTKKKKKKSLSKKTLKKKKVKR